MKTFIYWNNPIEIPAPDDTLKCIAVINDNNWSCRISNAQLMSCGCCGGADIDFLVDEATKNIDKITEYKLCVAGLKTYGTFIFF